MKPFEAEYSAAQYWVLVESPFWFQLGVRDTRLRAVMQRSRAATALLITPENPHSVLLRADENALRYQRFVADLNGEQWRYVQTEGRDPQARWPVEHGALVFGVRAEQVDGWLRRYGQNAGVVIDSEGGSMLCWHPDVPSSDERRGCSAR